MSPRDQAFVSDWDRLFDELYLKTYALTQRGGGDAEPLALGAMRLAGCEPPAEILDAACGYGRHALVLARTGSSSASTGRRSSWTRRVGARTATSGLADYRELPFDAERFDAVVNLFTSFGFFGEEGDLQALTEFRRVLRSGSALVVETLHRDRLMSAFEERGWEELPDGAVLLERRAFDSASGTVEVVFTYWPQAGAPSAATYRLRVYTPGELGGMARQAGFAEVELYGDPEGGPVSPESRLVLVARTP